MFCRPPHAPPTQPRFRRHTSALLAVLCWVGAGCSTSVNPVDAAGAQDAAIATDAAVGLADAGFDGGSALDAALRDAGVFPGSDAAADAGSSDFDAGASAGHVARSCGSPSQGLEPIDCTAGGDPAASCVFGNHCFCSEAFHCDGQGSDVQECEAAVVCVPD